MGSGVDAVAGPSASAKGVGGTLRSGTYQVVATETIGPSYPGRWVLKVSGGSITGTSYWSCCPGPRVDALTGSTGGGRVTITRDCSGQGQTSCVKQVYTGMIAADGSVRGTWESNDNLLGPWTMTRKPQETSLAVAVTPSVTSGAAGVGDSVTVKVKASAIGGDLSNVDFGDGLRSDNASVVVAERPSGLAGFDLAAGASRSFEFKVKATKQGVAKLTATATATATSGPVSGRGEATLKVVGDTPEFDYTMPARYQESALTKSYAQPDSFMVLFTVRGGDCDRDASYSWFVDGKPVAAHRTDPCVFAVDFDKLGTYAVRVEQTSDPASKPISFTKEVVVQDFLVAAIGDSLASGEGNPPYSPSACDRSKLAYPSLAAKHLEGADLRSSVTFLQFACSGANMAPISVRPGLIGAAQRFSTTPRETVYDQLLDLKDLVGDRKIDALTISVGINDVTVQVAGVDVGFARLVAIWRVAKSRCQNTCVSITDCAGAAKGLWAAVGVPADNLTIGDLMPEATDALSGLYDKLAEAVNEIFPSSQLDPADVYVVGYPDPLRNESGELCPVLIPKGDGGAAGGFENVDGEGEVSWFQQYFLTPLQHSEDRAASRFGWHYVDSNVSFATHGYCSTSSYFVHLGQFLAGKVNASGVLHPNGPGQATIADSLYEQMENRLLPDGHARKPS